jgi:hypothetical protein
MYTWADPFKVFQFQAYVLYRDSLGGQAFSGLALIPIPII